jgi:O-antigen/teichoic acid export membrane protein
MPILNCKHSMMPGRKYKTPLAKFLGRSEFIRNVFTIFSGNAIAQSIPFLLEPVVARLFVPQDFAIWTLYISVTNIFSVIATGRYELAIMLPSKERKAINLLALSLIITCFVSLFSFLIVWIFNTRICKILNNDDISGYLFFVPLSVLAIGWYQSLNYWASRNKRFRNVSYSRVAQTSSNGLLNMGFGFMGLRALGLMIAYLLGQIISVIPVGYSFIRRDIRKLKLVNRREMAEQASVYRDFPRINSVHALSDVAQQSTVVFLISYFFGNLVVGLHSKTMRLLFAPSSLIGSAIAQVFYQRASSEYSTTGDIRKLVLKTIRTLALIAVPGFSIVTLWGDSIFAFLLGENWRIAGEYAQILSPWICMSFIVAPVSQVPLIVNKQKQAFILSLIANGMILGSIFFAGLVAHQIKTAFYMISALMIIYYSFVIYWFLKISAKKI